MVPKTATIREIRTETSEVLSRLADGPIMLMNRSNPQAVIVSMEEWEQIQKDREYIKLLRATMDRRSS